MLRHSLLFATLLIASSSHDLFAQKTSPGVLQHRWSAQPGSNIQWVRCTPSGALLACTAEGLYGIDGESGKLLWTDRELAQASEYTVIWSTPFITVKTHGDVPELVHLEPHSGLIVHRSGSSPMNKVLRTFFAPRNKLMVLDGLGHDGLPLAIAVNTRTGVIAWEDREMAGSIQLVSDAGNDQVLIGTSTHAICRSSSGGTERWRQALVPSLDRGDDPGKLGTIMLVDQNAPGLLIMAQRQASQAGAKDLYGMTLIEGTSVTLCMAFRLADGTNAWAGPAVLPYEVGTLTALKTGALLAGSRDQGLLDLLDTRTGRPKWPLDQRGSVMGPLVAVADWGDQWLVQSGTRRTYCMLMDVNGAPLWTSPVQVSGAIQKAFLLVDAVVIVGQGHIKVLSKKDGTPITDGERWIAGDIVRTNGEDIFVYHPFGKELLHWSNGGRALGSSGRTLPVNDNEVPLSMEVLENGVLIRFDQHLARFDSSGGMLYSKPFPLSNVYRERQGVHDAEDIKKWYAAVPSDAPTRTMGESATAVWTYDHRNAPMANLEERTAALYGDWADGTAFKEFSKEAKDRMMLSSEQQPYSIFLSASDSGDPSLLFVQKESGEVAFSMGLGKDAQEGYAIDPYRRRVFLVMGAQIRAYDHD